jgi:hypothetical protein
LLGRIREAEPQVSGGEKIGDFVDSGVERRVVIGHERSPELGTTHNDLRLAVNPLSGGRLELYTREVSNLSGSGQQIFFVKTSP